MSTPQTKTELLKCAASSQYFIHEYCWLFDATRKAWLPFHLWPAQYRVLASLSRHLLHVILKARQLGLSWLCIAYALHMMLFEPGSVVLLFSRRDDEAKEMLNRLRGMHARLPDWLRQPLTTDNEHELAFANGSRAVSFATTKHSARSFTASLVIVDEAHFIQWFRQLLTAVKPTVDAGGQLIILSTINKEDPGGEFPLLFQEAHSGQNNYHATFLPWFARPDRDEDWYQAQQEDYSEDDLKQEYPATVAEALAPRSSAARFKSAWLDKAFVELDGAPHHTPATIYTPPQPGHRYLIPADPAEGAPTSDPSPAMVFDVETWEEVAVLHGQFEMHIFAGYLVALARDYNNAVIVPERNNHGHAVILQIRNLSYGHFIYWNPHDNKLGWLSNAKYKTLAVDHTAQVLREGGLTLHTQAAINELAIFEASTLKAPQGFHDDLAMTVIIGCAALRWPSARHSGDGESVVVEPEDWIDTTETGGW